RILKPDKCSLTRAEAIRTSFSSRSLQAVGYESSFPVLSLPLLGHGYCTRAGIQTPARWLKARARAFPFSLPYHGRHWTTCSRRSCQILSLRRQATL